MKPHHLAALLLAVPLIAGDVTIIGPLADGSIPPPLPAVQMAEARGFEVLSTTERQLDGRRLIIQRVKPPLLPAASAADAAAKPVLPPVIPVMPEAPGAAADTVPFALSATVVDRRATFLRWAHAGAVFEAWSSVDFNHLTGFSGFKRDARQYLFVLGIGNAAAEEKLAIPPQPAELRFDVPVFIVVKGDAQNAAALAPLTALHELYASDGSHLRAAYALREQRRIERAAAPPPPKPAGDIVLRYWEVTKPKQTGGAK